VRRGPGAATWRSPFWCEGAPSGQRFAAISGTSATVYMGAWEATDPNTGDGSNADVTVTRYYSAGGVQLASKSTGGPTLITLGDVQGSAQVTVDATGAVTRNAYTPYGTKRAGSNVASAHGWLNQIADADTGLTYLNARYYDPALGRFLSPDPLMNPGDPRTLDPYRYADNNPVVYMDATGLNPSCVGFSLTSSCWTDYMRSSSPGARARQAQVAIISKAVIASRRPGGELWASPQRLTRGPADLIFSRVKNEANYRIQRLERRQSQSLAQNQFDDESGTSSTEIAHAMAAIWKDGADLYSKGEQCGKVMECFAGADFDFGTMTKGHSVVSKHSALDPKLQRHEAVHVAQYERTGGRAFFWNYAGGYTARVLEGLRVPGVWAADAIRARGNLVEKVNHWPYSNTPAELEAHAAE